MNKKSIKVNFMMNSILSVSSFIFPLITFPYVSRILMPSGTGVVNFANSIINYVLTFSMLGIPLYGVKACAIDKIDKKKLSNTVIELLILNIIVGTISMVVLLAMTFCIGEFRSNWKIIGIMSMIIPLNILGVEWFYRAMEEYYYISIRNIIFKFIGVILMFTFVHSREDYLKYAITIVIAGSGSYLLNFVKLKKYVEFGGFSNLDLKRHIKPVLSFFLLSVSWMIYSNTDVIMLGLMKGDEAVGYYSAALRIKSIILGIVSALSAVLMPRVVNFFADKKYDEAYRVIRKNSSFVLLSSLYFIVYIIINAREIINLLAGDGFLPAINVIQVTIISVLLVGFSSLFGTNVLVSIGKEKVTVVASFVGIAVNILLNFLLIPKQAALGAGVATVVGEFCIIICEVLWLGRCVLKCFNLSNFVKIIISSTLSTIALIAVKAVMKSYLLTNNMFSLFVYITVSGAIYTAIYILTLYFQKEEIVWSNCRQVANRLANSVRNV